MPKTNYHQARRQKEAVRKSRQQEKQQRRSTRVDPLPVTPDGAGTEAVVTEKVDPTAPL